MAKAIDPRDEVFLDTSYALALSAPTNQHHDRALRLADELEAAQARLVTTHAVLLEIGNALSRRRHRAATIHLLRALESDPSVVVRGTPGGKAMNDLITGCQASAGGPFAFHSFFRGFKAQ